MITRDQFEALVRAEAAKEYPFASAVGSMLSSRAIHRLEEFDDKAELKREAYIAARMEHEWPLVEWLDELTRQCSTLSKQAASEISPLTLQQCRAVLFPYTTKL